MQIINAADSIHTQQSFTTYPQADLHMVKAPWAWRYYHYFDPQVVLPRIHEVRLQLKSSSLPEKVKSLRTNHLKHEREAWDAAVFCYLMSKVLDVKMQFCCVEDADYDCIFTWQDSKRQYYTPVQLKELVPTHKNPTCSLDSIINSLQKYADSEDLMVGIKLNRNIQVNFSEIKLPTLGVGEIYCFGATRADESRWALIGDIQSQYEQWELPLPT